MDVKAVWKYIRISPKKLRLVADTVRGKRVTQAGPLLLCSRKKGAQVISKLVKSAISNANNTGEMDMDSLYIKRINVDEGPAMIRYMPRAMGRVNKISRRTSHATIILSDY